MKPQRNDEWSRRAWEEIEGHPGRVSWLAVKKVGRTWSPFFNAGGYQRPLVQTAMGLWQIPLFGLALVGLFAGLLPLRVKGLLLVPVVYFSAVHALFIGSVRYRVAVMPVVCVFAACGIVYLWRRMRTGKRDVVGRLNMQGH